MSAPDDLKPSSSPEIERSVELPPLYYLHNFDQMLAHVLSQHDDIWHHDERQLAETITQLDTCARALLVRFFTRKGWIFRPDKLVYPELDDIAKGLQALIAEGLIHPGQPEDNTALGCFTKAELLLVVAGQSHLDGAVAAEWKRLKRPELEQRLLEWEYAHELNQRLAERTVWVSEVARHFLVRMQLLYFGNLHQSLTEFVLRDLGLYRYHSIELNEHTRGFENRTMLDRHLQYYQLLEQLGTLSSDETEAWWDLDQQLAALQQREDGSDHRLRRRIQRQRLHIARHLERQGDNERALSIYQDIPQHPARERAIRILSKSSPLQSLELCQQAWLNPYSDDEQAFLESFAPRLIKRLQKSRQLDDIDWFQEPDVIAEESLSLCEDEKPSLGKRGFVESAALLHLEQRQAGQGFHVENALFSAVFGLVFWPVIFASVKGAFFHPFQSQPDDYGEPNFWHKRDTENEKIWQHIRSGGWKPMLEDQRKISNGIVNPLVHWGFVDYAQDNGLWQLALDRIPDADWVAIFQYLAGDLKSRSRGMPDLIWFPDAGGYQLFEVKGPGDALRQSQIGWLRCLQTAKIDGKVLYVT